MAEIETIVRKIGGSWYVRIPHDLAEYMKIEYNAQRHNGKDKDKAKIKDVNSSTLQVKFPLW